METWGNPGKNLLLKCVMLLQVLQDSSKGAQASG